MEWGSDGVLKEKMDARSCGGSARSLRIRGSKNFDAIGRWRTVEDGQPIDATGGLPDGSKFTGVSGLEQGLLRRPEVFVGTLTEKLFTFALGRGVEYYDAPAVRKIVRQAKGDDFRFTSIILGIVNSTPFIMRNSL